MANVLVDSNFLVAYFNRKDSLHQKASSISKNALFNASNVYISNYVFLETSTIIAQKVSKKASILIGDYILNDSSFKLLHIDAYLHKVTWEIFNNINKKNVSFVDCSLLAVIQEQEIDNLLTFDTKDFKSFQKKFKFKIIS